MNWSLLPTMSASMPFQMALDEILFGLQKDKLQDPVLRFYASSEPWISAGYSFRSEIALEKSTLVAQNSRVPVCGRITGGGCVLHGRDLIFSLTGRYETALSALGSVRTSYRMLHEAVTIGLRFCGLEPEFYARGESLPKGSDCFDFPVESDLSFKEKKIAGGAQKRSEGVLLHHESIAIPPGIERDSLVHAVRKGLEQVFGVTIQATDMEPELFFAAARTEAWKKPGTI